MFICRVSPQAFPTNPHFLPQPLVCLPSTPPSATSPYPPMLYSISISHLLLLSAPPLSTIHPLLLLSLLSPLSLPPPIPLTHSTPSFSLFPPSLPFFAQDRSALITLMALMIQLNGALSPRCLSKAFLCSLLVQQHSAVTATSVPSLWAQ